MFAYPVYLAKRESICQQIEHVMSAQSTVLQTVTKAIVYTGL